MGLRPKAALCDHRLMRTAAWLLGLSVSWPALWTRGAEPGPECPAGAGLRLALSQAPPDRVLPLLTVWTEPPADLPATCLGRVCRVELPARAVPELLRRPTLLLAAPPARRRPRMDRAGEMVRLPQARTETGLTGQGALISVIDTGLDFFHPDFIDASGKTRVAWLLDQNRPPEGLYPDLEAIGGGAVYSAVELQAALDGRGGPALGAGRDLLGHGTHVAGIAAGGDDLYPGVAPGARLIAIKALREDLSGFDDDRLLSALAFSRAVSEREGLPLVVNLSLGSQLGAHDGSEPIELALDELCALREPAAAAVVAAGNDRGRGWHARLALNDGDEARLRLLIPSAQAPNPSRPASVTLDLWADAPGPLEARIETPSGEISDAVSSQGPFGLSSWTADGHVSLSTSPQETPFSRPQRLIIELSDDPGVPLRTGTWTVHLRGASARVDAWVGDYDLAALALPRFLDHLDEGNLVGPPATARCAVAAGALISRLSWTDADGQAHAWPGVAGTAADFSSAGPTRDGRAKPEILAPGYLIAAAMSQDADSRSASSIFYSGGAQERVMPDGKHALSGGTSMASPLVAGLLALAFEADPSLSGDALRDMVAASGTADPALGGTEVYQPRFGFGRADAVLLLRLARGERGRALDPAQSLCGTNVSWLPPFPQGQALALAVPRDAEGLALGGDARVSFFADPGVVFADSADSRSLVRSGRFSGAGSHGTRVRLTCRAEDMSFSAHPRVVLAASETEAAELGADSGCATASGSASLWGLAIALAAFALRRARSRARDISARGRWLLAAPASRALDSLARGRWLLAAPASRESDGKGVNALAALSGNRSSSRRCNRYRTNLLRCSE